MEILVKKSDLVRELQLAQGIVERKNSIPILSNVLAEARDGELRLSATDLDISLRCGCEAQVVKAGSITLSAKKLYEIARALPESDVHIASGADSWTTIKSERVNYRMAGLPREDFPTLPEATGRPSVTVPGEILRDLIARTSFAITAEDARYFLAGALFVIEKDSVALVATDGHRLSYVRRTYETGAEPQRVLVPRKAVIELARLVEQGGEVAFQRVENHLIFVVGDRVLASKMIEGQFPAFEKVILVSGDKAIEITRDSLATAIRRVSLLSSERSRAIKVTLTPGSLEVTANSPELGEARESVSVEYAGPEVSIGFNAQYILDFLGAVGTEIIRLELRDADSQGILTPVGDDANEYRYVVMPMRF